jgi:hypothetical protein
MMDYEEVLRGRVAVVKAEGRYRTFANNSRTRLQEVWLRLRLPMAKIDLEQRQAADNGRQIGEGHGPCLAPPENPAEKDKDERNDNESDRERHWLRFPRDGRRLGRRMPPAVPESRQGKARIRRLGRAAHYIAGGILAAIHRRRLEQKMTTPLAGGWSGIFR